MAKKIVDISKFINNDAPEMVLFGKTYTVKNDKTTILLMNELQRKNALEKRKKEVNGDLDGADEIDMKMDEQILKLLLGETPAKEVMNVINNSSNYVENEKAILLNVIALATGSDYDDLVSSVNNTPR